MIEKGSRKTAPPDTARVKVHKYNLEMKHRTVKNLLFIFIFSKFNTLIRFISCLNKSWDASQFIDSPTHLFLTLNSLIYPRPDSRQRPAGLSRGQKLLGPRLGPGDWPSAQWPSVGVVLDPLITISVKKLINWNAFHCLCSIFRHHFVEHHQITQDSAKCVTWYSDTWYLILRISATHIFWMNPSFYFLKEYICYSDLQNTRRYSPHLT